MDSDAEKICRSCHGCQVVGDCGRPEEMARIPLPTIPWEMCAADLLGPLPPGESIWVVVDYYSWWNEIVVMRSTTSPKLIETFELIFGRLGVQDSLRADNRPQFVSEDFEAFLSELNVDHVGTTPLWPQANGEVERQNWLFMKAVKMSKVEGKNWKRDIVKYRMAYRPAPQVTTWGSRYFLIYGREMKTKPPEFRKRWLDAEERIGEKIVLDEGIRDKD